MCHLDGLNWTYSKLRTTYRIREKAKDKIDGRASRVCVLSDIRHKKIIAPASVLFIGECDFVGMPFRLYVYRHICECHQRWLTASST